MLGCASEKKKSIFGMNKTSLSIPIAVFRLTVPRRFLPEEGRRPPLPPPPPKKKVHFESDLKNTFRWPIPPPPHPLPRAPFLKKKKKKKKKKKIATFSPPNLPAKKKKLVKFKILKKNKSSLCSIQIQVPRSTGGSSGAVILCLCVSG